jgi:phage gp29-like protein
MIATGDLARQYRETRFNPLRSLSPERLAAALDSWEAGDLRGGALVFEAICRRDAIVNTVMRKRTGALSRCHVQITPTLPGDPESEAHAGVLKTFYHNVRVTDAANLNLRQRIRGLGKQLLGAVLQSYSAHEIDFQEGPGGLSGEIRHVPIYFFENRTGRLRFIGAERRSDGVPLADGQWIVAATEGIGEAISIVYMIRRLFMQDALSTSDKFAVPAILGETNHKKGTPEGEAFEAAIAAFGSEFVGCIFNSDGKIREPIKIIQTAAAGIPQLPTIEYLDRLICKLVRGSDLDTMSAAHRTGAGVQGDEGNALLADDCKLISEVLQVQLDPLVIGHAFGSVKPLAHIEFMPPAGSGSLADLRIDEGTDALGVKQDPAKLAARYGRVHYPDLARARCNH